MADDDVVIRLRAADENFGALLQTMQGRLKMVGKSSQQYEDARCRISSTLVQPPSRTLPRRADEAREPIQEDFVTLSLMKPVLPQAHRRGKLAAAVPKQWP